MACEQLEALAKDIELAFIADDAFTCMPKHFGFFEGGPKDGDGEPVDGSDDIEIQEKGGRYRSVATTIIDHQSATWLGSCDERHHAYCFVWEV